VNQAKTPYVGRFAPSPTGPLHLGSLVAAVGSFLRARSQGGRWLVRIEDIDPPREQRGAADVILRALEWHGLEWDDEVLYQSRRMDRYAAALDALAGTKLVYPCTCTRKEIRAHHLEVSGSVRKVYPGLCRSGPVRPDRRSAYRLRVPAEVVEFTDLEIGVFRQDLPNECGDFVVKRRDGLFAYQLAVVVDDAAQGITEVVRGQDLLDSTPGQIVLQRFLAVPTPRYLHLPLVMSPGGGKLSKQTGARGLRRETARESLAAALEFLGLAPPADIRNAAVTDALHWAIGRWPRRKAAAGPNQQ
jgi:glutamyl-Q tRNA(Asp) synthetase